MNKIASILIFLTTSTSFPGWTQGNTASTILKKLDAYRNGELREKVFVHTDQTSYVAGETLWFKVYVTDATTHRLSSVSKVAYVEMLDKDNNPVLQTKVDISKGTGSGGIFIPASINSGNFLLRCYTQWMKNFSEEFFFSEKIKIINTFKKIQRLDADQETAYDVAFLPEGGHLVNGLKSRVAVRATNAYGKGVAFRGSVLNSKGDTIASCKSGKFGMGDFEFTPQEGESYKAVVRPEGAKWLPVAFPQAESQGVVLSVTTDPQALKVTFQTARVSSASFVLLVHCRGVVRFNKSITLPMAEEQTIQADLLGEGINAITLFDGNLNPVAERLVFNHPSRPVTLDIQPSAEKFGPRSKVNISISFSAATENASTGKASLAVYRQDPLAEFEAPDIRQYLLLSSDLKGTVESPGYYFSDPSSTRRELDLVMLCHGWSRFDWKEIFSGSGPEIKFIPEYRGPIVTGQVFDNNGSPTGGVLTYLASPGINIETYPSVSSTSGLVRFEMKSFFGPRKVILQTDFSKDSVYKFKIENPFSDHYPRYRLPRFELTPAATQEILRRSVAMQVTSIYKSSDSTKAKLAEGTTFYGKGDESYRLDDYTRFPVMEEVLREYVSGIWVHKRGNNFSFQVPDKVNGKLIEEKPLVLLDGVPVFSVNALMAMDPLKIKSIDIVGRKYYLDGQTLSGIASFRTYAGDLAGFSPDPRALTFDYDGLQLKKIFYSPKYDSPEEIESRIPDRRNLLQWVPDLELTRGQPLSTTLYTSDLKGKFTIVVQGVTHDGIPFSKSRDFSVE